MTLFADTSALAKLYVQEQGSDRMLAWAASTSIAVSVLALPEMHATLARRRREALLDEQEHAMLVARFAEDWRGTLRVALDEHVLERIPSLCVSHPLRGTDAVHLASALFLRSEGLAVTFVCSDERLLSAARDAGLEVLDPVAG